MVPLVPIVVRERGSVPPEEPLHYALTADGVFEVRDTALYRSETKAVVKLPGLERGEEQLEIRMPRLPSSLMTKAVAFFAEVNRRCGSEGVLILFYDPSSRSFRAEAPPQIVRLDVTSPETVVSGKETTFAVSFANTSDKELGCAEIAIRLPAGTTVLDDVHAMGEEQDAFCAAYGFSSVAFADSARPDILTFRVGTLAPHSEGTVRFNAVPFGPSGRPGLLVMSVQVSPPSVER